MDVAERSDEFEFAIKAAAKEQRASLWTAMPATVVKYDPVRQTADVQPTIMGVHPDPAKPPITMPVCGDCPVVFPSGGGYTLTFPIAAGDECLVVFASRCIDAWWQSGGVQPQAEMRMHDLSDGFVIPGPRSQPRKLANVLTTGVEIRSDDGTEYIRMEPTGITMVAPMINLN